MDQRSEIQRQDPLESPTREGGRTATSWHIRSRTDVLAELGARTDGLSAAEAEDRLHRHGPNELPAADATPAWKVAGSPVRQPADRHPARHARHHERPAALGRRGAIALILVLNAGIGFWQERRAESAVRALQQLTVLTCRVRRDGQDHTVPATELVPGDVVLLESGDRVPADLRLLEVNGLQVDESMLTGEVLPVTKQVHRLAPHTVTAERTNLAFSGTLVTAGRGLGVVVATGIDTELGQINELVQGPRGKTPLQVLAHQLERRIGAVVAASSALVFVVGLALGHGVSEMFRTAVALAVASVPESLPIVLTVAMSLGVARMARHHAIVRSLTAVETLGSTTVIGSDKTGTLTRNELTVEAVWTADRELDLRDEAEPGGPLTAPLRAALRTGALTNEASRASAEAVAQGAADYLGDAVDVAMLRAAERTGVVTDAERDDRWVAHAPYEPELGLSQTVRTEQGRRVLHVKGSPDRLAALCTTMATEAGPVPFDPDAVSAANHRFADDGMRVLATASRILDDAEPASRPLPPPSGLTFLGLEAMEDPPRPGAAQAVAACQEAGITVVMITGDHPATAASIGRHLGLGTGAAPVTGAEMAELTDSALVDRLRSSGVAARVSPQDKLRIVRALQDHDEVVAVTGDGVNDAPALRAASIGVAMGRSGTAVAREASDVVLTDDNFVTVVDAVEQGRVTFNAIRKGTFFLIASGLSALLAVAANLVTDQPLLFIPIQLLFINVVTNGVQDIALSFEPPEGDELRRPPRPRGEGLLSRTLWVRTVLSAVWMAVVILLTFRWGLTEGLAEDHARTLALTVLVTLNFWLVLSARAEYRSLFTMNPLGNRFLLVSAVGALLLLVACAEVSVTANLLGLVPLSPLEWVACLALGSTLLVVVELHKWLGRRRLGL
ncbi:HAD family hydrolase [Nocardioides jishulii]|uniref:cation-translocating P-type ATPase n=1 Tax=Nocardioides jishulii TaxID=2575440 RepID=UPI00110E9DAB|nr:HAD-IC family P-type ATPase [Nocardioides jishulii]QCX26336.1 HAD family hydrolase [Nocardioides jishulii]